ncbi:MAG: adenylosuccinate lyase [Salibacteraceae bacterium]
MPRKALTSVSPVDGRYARHTEPLIEFFSEYALFKYRVRIEIEYLILLASQGLKNIDPLTDAQSEKLRSLYLNFTLQDADSIKQIERVTNHDVKAVEYFVKEQLEKIGRKDLLEFVHFGLTSQDINNTAVPLSIKEAQEQVLMPRLLVVLDKIRGLAMEWKEIPMLARTHGQPASPTNLGKEFYVFAERLQQQITQMGHIPFAAKFGGATGNFNAHHVAFPTKDWIKFSNAFVNDVLGLHRSQTTTQIEHYDHLAALLDAWKRINTILIDLCRDVWTYISMDYFKQKIKEGEVGSSAMPHKVNPIDFENAEGNLGFSNAMSEHLSSKLPVSRLQRDLTDSTVLRNIGMPFSHALIALASIEKGLDKLILNEGRIKADLDEHWEVCAEAIQTVLRREGYDKPYEALKDLTRGSSKVTPASLAHFIDQLKVSDEVKEELKRITPHNYIGIFELSAQ